MLGSGVGSFPDAVTPVLHQPKAGHNAPLTLLVELGVVGGMLFAALIVTCLWTIASLPPPERKLWAVLMVSLLVMAIAHDSHVDKTTWVLFGLLAAQRGLRTVRVPFPEKATMQPFGPMEEPLPYARRI